MTNAPRKERSKFSDKDGETILNHAESCVRSALLKKPLPKFDHQQSELAESPVVGVFVSLKRGPVLRACCGSLNEIEPAPLIDLLEAAANRSAIGDVRFPRIAESEIDSLDLEVSVMHNLRTMPTNPNLRIKNITIGRHGLIISHPRGRGLLLPQVASDNSWDSVTFLQQVCRKANLPTDTWLHAEAEIKQFSASIFHRDATKPDVDFRDLPSDTGPSVLKFATALIKEGPAKAGPVPDELKVKLPAPGWGLLIQTSEKITEAVFRNEGTLAELVFDTAKSLHRPCKSDHTIQDILAFSYPIPLNPEDYPGRLNSIPPGAAVTAHKGNRTSVVIKRGPKDPVAQVLEQIGLQPENWKKSDVNLCLYQILNLSHPEKTNPASPAHVSSIIDGVRTPAVAGSFYPETESAIKGDLDRFFAKYNTPEKSNVRAVMLPHAGWKYCGDIIAETLGHIDIPDIVVIIGPKHTPLGSNWSISNAKRWKIPGAEVPLDEESVAYLAATVKNLDKEELAHQKEHGIEVLVPFLHYLNPKVRIVPVVVGSGTHDQFVEFGKSLQHFRERLDADGDKCLFIISSDMNHFAEDKVNRELDKKALDAFKTGNTKTLFDTCTKNNISMCGMRPAVAVLSSLGVDVEKHCPDIEIVRYETSARISKNPARVVGYAGVLIG